MSEKIPQKNQDEFVPPIPVPEVNEEVPKAKREKEYRTDEMHLLDSLVGAGIDLDDVSKSFDNYIDGNGNVIGEKIKFVETIKGIIDDIYPESLKLAESVEEISRKSNYGRRVPNINTRGINPSDLKEQMKAISDITQEEDRRVLIEENIRRTIRWLSGFMSFIKRNNREAQSIVLTSDKIKEIVSSLEAKGIKTPEDFVVKYEETFKTEDKKNLLKELSNILGHEKTASGALSINAVNLREASFKNILRAIRQVIEVGTEVPIAKDLLEDEEFRGLWLDYKYDENGNRTEKTVEEIYNDRREAQKRAVMEFKSKVMDDLKRREKEIQKKVGKEKPEEIERLVSELSSRREYYWKVFNKFIEAIGEVSRTKANFEKQDKKIPGIDFVDSEIYGDHKAVMEKILRHEDELREQEANLVRKAVELEYDDPADLPGAKEELEKINHLRTILSQKKAEVERVAQWEYLLKEGPNNYDDKRKKVQDQLKLLQDALIGLSKGRALDEQYWSAQEMESKERGFVGKEFKLEKTDFRNSAEFYEELRLLLGDTFGKRYDEEIELDEIDLKTGKKKRVRAIEALYKLLTKKEEYLRYLDTVIKGYEDARDGGEELGISSMEGFTKKVRIEQKSAVEDYDILEQDEKTLDDYKKQLFSEGFTRDSWNAIRNWVRIKGLQRIKMIYNGIVYDNWYARRASKFITMRDGAKAEIERLNGVLEKLGTDYANYGQATATRKELERQARILAEAEMRLGKANIGKKNYEKGRMVIAGDVLKKAEEYLKKDKKRRDGIEAVRNKVEQKLLVINESIERKRRRLVEFKKNRPLNMGWAEFDSAIGDRIRAIEELERERDAIARELRKIDGVYEKIAGKVRYWESYRDRFSKAAEAIATETPTGEIEESFASGFKEYGAESKFGKIKPFDSIRVSESKVVAFDKLERTNIVEDVREYMDAWNKMYGREFNITREEFFKYHKSRGNDVFARDISYHLMGTFMVDYLTDVMGIDDVIALSLTKRFNEKEIEKNKKLAPEESVAADENTGEEATEQGEEEQKAAA